MPLHLIDHNEAYALAWTRLRAGSASLEGVSAGVTTVTAQCVCNYCLSVWFSEVRQVSDHPKGTPHLYQGLDKFRITQRAHHTYINDSNLGLENSRIEGHSPCIATKKYGNQRVTALLDAGCRIWWSRVWSLSLP